MSRCDERHHLPQKAGAALFKAREMLEQQVEERTIELRTALSDGGSMERMGPQ
jgi:hypothetical protein